MDDKLARRVYEDNILDRQNKLEADVALLQKLYVASIATPPTTTAANDVQVGDGAGAWITKTLAQFKTILSLGTAAFTASTDYAVAAKGVTNGDAHDHSGGDGAQIAYGGLSGLPTLGAQFVPLTTVLTSTSFDGDSFSNVAKTLIDLSAVYGVPAGIKAVVLYMACRDSASAANSPYVGFSPNNTAGSHHGVCSCQGLTNDKLSYAQLTIPCDANGDIYYQIAATGASTFDLWLNVVGYYV